MSEIRQRLKEVADRYGIQKVYAFESRGKEEARILEKMAGYRIRMVHFYQEITPDELYEICRDHLDEMKQALDRLVEWLRNNKGKLDEGI